MLEPAFELGLSSSVTCVLAPTAYHLCLYSTWSTGENRQEVLEQWFSTCGQ